MSRIDAEFKLRFVPRDLCDQARLLPSGRDGSYPGLVRHDDLLKLSYSS